MNRDFRFTPDRVGIEQVANGPAVAIALNAAAADAKRRMDSAAARMRPGSFFEFRHSIQVIPAKTFTGREPVAYVGSTSPGWHLQEYGTLYHPPDAIIRRAMRMVKGLTFEEGT
jgi:hypothetical protein